MTEIAAGDWADHLLEESMLKVCAKHGCGHSMASHTRDWCHACAETPVSEWYGDAARLYHCAHFYRPSVPDAAYKTDEDRRTSEPGKMVRDVWLAWARLQPDAKPSWLVSWDELDSGQRHVDALIEMAVRVDERESMTSAAEGVVLTRDEAALLVSMMSARIIEAQDAGVSDDAPSSRFRIDLLNKLMDIRDGASQGADGVRLTCLVCNAAHFDGPGTDGTVSLAEPPYPDHQPEYEVNEAAEHPEAI